MNTCGTCGQVYLPLAAHACPKTTARDKPLPRRLTIAELNDLRDRADDRSVIYCAVCNRPSDSHIMPVFAGVCAFCWHHANRQSFYMQWFRIGFIMIAYEARETKRGRFVDYSQAVPGIELIHHKSDSQAIIRCLTTVVREQKSPPSLAMLLTALNDCYIAGKYRADFLAWRDAMANAIVTMYNEPRKPIIKSSQGRQTDQGKLNLFGGEF